MKICICVKQRNLKQQRINFTVNGKSFLKVILIFVNVYMYNAYMHVCMYVMYILAAVFKSSVPFGFLQLCNPRLLILHVCKTHSSTPAYSLTISSLNATCPGFTKAFIIKLASTRYITFQSVKPQCLVNNHGDQKNEIQN